MSNGSILTVSYPLPAKKISSSGYISSTGQMLAVTSTATAQFTAWTEEVRLVTLDIQLANVYCTFDGSTPSSSSGHILYQGANFTWHSGMATQAKFVATTTATTQIYASPLQN